MLTETVLAKPTPEWLLDFLKKELAPYPRRAETVARMVIAATLVMIICMAFRIPYAFQGAIYVLLISRETPRATLESAGTIFLLTCISAGYVLTSARLVINFPVIHFLWIIGTFFLAFYALSTISNAVASTFVIMIAVVVPFLDRHLPAETNVEDTLWLVWSISIGIAVTTAAELAVARFRPGDDIVLPIAERLAAVHNLLDCYAEKRPPDEAAQKKVTDFSVLGTSTMRRALRRSAYSPHYRTQMGGVVALVGRLLDISATLPQLNFDPSESDRKQLRKVNSAIEAIRTDLMNRQISRSIQFSPDKEHVIPDPLLGDVENTVTLIAQVFAGSRSLDEYMSDPDDRRQLRLFVADAFDNPEHLKFALKGCFAAAICYMIYNSMAWPGISTAVTTCLLTGLSTVGASRQKQILRFAGAVVGGFILGMGSQVFVLPYLNSIAGFTVLFIFVTAFASWFMTCSPRLSYFGLQVALAFYLINLQEFAMQTSLSIARDRVVGILLGLCVMWLVFDQLWGVPAAEEMRMTFISNLRLIAQLARESLLVKDKSRRIDTFRETISANFDKVRSMADAVVFEFGPSRQQNLELRNRIRQWQPRLHTLLVTQLALMKRPLEFPVFELQEDVRVAQQEFEDQLAGILDSMANRVAGKASQQKDHFEKSFENLEQTIRSRCSEEGQESFKTELQTVLALSRNIESLTMSLNIEIGFLTF